jgi:tRNA(fMet)-specific endonuclease VapC
MGLKIAIDTNRYVDFCRGEETAVDYFRKASQIYMPFVSLAELRAGFLCGTKAFQNEKILIKFLASSRVETLYADNQTTHHYARLFSQLRKQGTPIPTNDIWIAALVLQYNLILFARDQHFDNLPQIPKL